MEAKLYSFFNGKIDLLYLFLHTSVRQQETYDVKTETGRGYLKVPSL